jgi:hypothetical protein
MTIDSVTKGLVTKASKLTGAARFRALRKAFERLMPREQAKHAARKFIG